MSSRSNELFEFICPDTSQHPSATATIAPPMAIGQPVYFTSGQFKGRWVRAELLEIQKADLGRKYGVKDRRPIDPPPVVELRLYQIHDYGTSQAWECELNYGDVSAESLICHLDLLSASPEQGAPFPSISTSATTEQRPLVAFSEFTQANLENSAFSSSSVPTYQPFLPSASYTGDAFIQSTHERSGYPATQFQSEQIVSTTPLPFYGDSQAFKPSLPTTDPSLPSATTSPAISHSSTGFTRDNDMRTRELAGSTFTQAVKLAYEGKTNLLFVFSDLSVRTEGVFRLRYRCFDVLANALGPNDRPIIAECHGGTFKIWGTKGFPGLAKSTPLTMLLLQQGVRTNHRDQKRPARGLPAENKPERERRL